MTLQKNIKMTQSRLKSYDEANLNITLLQLGSQMTLPPSVLEENLLSTLGCNKEVKE